MTPSIRSSIVWLSSLAGIGHLASFLSFPVLISFYSPGDFGAFAIVTALAIMAGNVSALRYERAIVLAETEKQAQLLVRICLALNCSIGLFFAVCLVVTKYLNIWQLKPGWNLLAMGATLIVLSGFQQTATHWLIRREHFRRIGIVDFSFAIGTLVIQLLLGIFGAASVESLLWGVLVGRLLAIGIASRSVLNCLKDLVFPIYEIKKLLYSYRSLAFFSTPYVIVGTLQFRSLLFLSAHFGSLADAGYLALAYRLTYVPATAFGMVLRRVFFPAFSKRLNELRTRQQSLKMLILLGVTVPPTIVGISIMLPRMSYLLPSDWQGAVPYLCCLLPISGIIVFTSWFDRIYDVLHRQRSALILETSASLIAVGAFSLILGATSSLMLSLHVYALLLFVYNIAWLGYTWHLIQWPQTHFLRGVSAGIIYTIGLCFAYGLLEISLLLAMVFLLCSISLAWLKIPSFTLWVVDGNDSIGKKTMA